MTGFLATIAVGDFRLRELDASTGASDPHDFTVRNGALVCCTTASTAPRTLRRDDRETPLWWAGMRAFYG